jgi:uncharacterized protein YdeI (YjbR/CyaY-like superfamily)
MANAMRVISVSDRREWRSWLIENHASEKEVWLAYYKKHTGKATVSYMESVKEALCFGWIDGLKKSIDDQRYAHRFTPRRAGSKWSPQNTRLAKELIESGDMMKAGQAAFDQGVPYDQEFQKVLSAKEIPLTAETEKGLKTSQKAWTNFNQMSAGYRKQYVLWLQSAKRPDTRKKRLEEALRLLEKNQKLGMK